MDSMRGLNTALPKTRKPKPTPQPNVHQIFRTAALTVTNLYKSALADLERSRADGYQEALEDLVGFLNKQNLGVSDGEGWRIRQWAMEHLDGALRAQSNSDSEEEVAEEKRARSSSPVIDRNSSPEETRAVEPPQHDSAQRSDSAPPPVQVEASSPDVQMAPPQGIFHFSSPTPYPNPDPSDASGPDPSTSTRRTVAASRRPSARPSRNLQRQAAANNIFPMGNGAGHKRRLMQEFFNIDGFNDRRDGSGGGGSGKRGRLS